MSVAAMKKIRLQVDTLAADKNNERRIHLIEEAFGQLGQPLGHPKRALIGRGYLTKVCRRKNKQRVFFLFSDCLVYGAVIQEDKQLDQEDQCKPKTVFSKQHRIPLETMRVKPLADMPVETPVMAAGPNGKQVEVTHLCNLFEVGSSHKSFMVVCQSATERDMWIQYLQIFGSLARNDTGYSDAQIAPTWKSDWESDKCMKCQKLFTIINRKHHCRKCGLLVCDGCSRRRCIIPQQSSKPLRVCDGCYKEAMNQSPHFPRSSIKPVSEAADSDDTSDSEEEPESKGPPSLL